MFFFFFQAEDGIRDDLVTGVQTCALPISGNVVFATNIATLATSGVVLLFCLVAFGSKVTRSLIRDMHDFQAEQAKESKSAKTTTKPKAT